MTDNYVRRLNYSNGQLLDVSDFADEQRYHVDQRRLHNRQLHGFGIVDGLEVDLTDDGTDLAVRPGAALDDQGREIVLTGPDPEPVKLKAQVPPLRGTTVYLTIAYREEDDDRAEMVVKDDRGGKIYSRRRVQKPSIQTPAAAATDGSAIVLARVTVDAAGKLSIDDSVRTRSGGLRADTGLAVRRAVIGGADGVRLGASGGAGLVTFTSVDAAGASADGLTWFATQPADYGIHRTVGPWEAGNGYQQLRIRWITGIVLDPGDAYAKSWVEVQGKGLRVSAGGVSVGTTYGAAATGTLLVQGQAGVGTDKPSAQLDVGKGDPAATTPSLQLRGGNVSTGTTSTQITFGYNNTAGYRHAIRTRHNGSGASGNAIDFYVWRWVDANTHDKVEDIGTQHVLTLDSGRVGIGTTEPGDFKLRVAGGDSRFEGSMVLNGRLVLGPTPGEVVALPGNKHGIGTQADTVYLRSNKNFAFYQGGWHDDADLSPGGDAGQAGTLRMVIADGKVGIGATGPQAQLDVEGDAIVSGAIKGRYRDAPELAKQRVPVGPATLYPAWFEVVTKQQAATLQGWATGATAQPATHPPHLYTFGYRLDGKRPEDLFFADLNTGVLKTFAIDHPQHADRYLLHATLEGPEGAVYYRGSARLSEGRAEIRLPPYFEALTRAEGRTVLLTNVDGWDPIAVLSQEGRTIREGAFVVASSNPRSTQAFDWEVKAVRGDAPELEVEPEKRAARIERFGPYAYRRS